MLLVLTIQLYKIHLANIITQIGFSFLLEEQMLNINQQMKMDGYELLYGIKLLEIH